MSYPLYLLDTSVLLVLVRGNTLGQKINEKFQLTQMKNRALISIVTHGEIWVLARRGKWGEKKSATLQNALDNLVTVDLSHPEIIDAYVEIELLSQSETGGARNMGKNDLWIAACATASGAELITLDRDFEHLSGLMTVHLVDTAIH